MFTNLTPASDFNLLLSSLCASGLYFSHFFVLPDPHLPHSSILPLPSSTLSSHCLGSQISSKTNHIPFPSFPFVINFRSFLCSTSVRTSFELFNFLPQTKIIVLERVQPNRLTLSCCLPVLHLILDCNLPTCQ